MLQRIHDGGDALGEEIGAEHDRERQHGLHWSRQQQHAGEHGQRGRDQRPPEARCAARPIGHDQPADAADQEHPAEEDRDRKARERRQDQRGNAENGEQDAFKQKGLPMRLHRLAHGGLQP